MHPFYPLSRTSEGMAGNPAAARVKPDGSDAKVLRRVVVVLDDDQGLSGEAFSWGCG